MLELDNNKIIEEMDELIKNEDKWMECANFHSCWNYLKGELSYNFDDIEWNVCQECIDECDKRNTLNSCYNPSESDF